MIDVICYRLINRLRKDLHTIQPRSTYPLHPSTIQAIFIYNPFAVKSITYTYCVIRQYLPKTAIGAEIRTVSSLTTVCIFVSVRISAGRGSSRRNHATTQVIASNTINIQGSFFMTSTDNDLQPYQHILRQLHTASLLCSNCRYSSDNGRCSP